jgi:hypothetical protein
MFEKGLIMQFNQITPGTVFSFDFDKNNGWVYKKLNTDTIECVGCPKRFWNGRNESIIGKHEKVITCMFNEVNIQDPPPEIINFMGFEITKTFNQGKYQFEYTFPGFGNFYANSFEAAVIHIIGRNNGVDSNMVSAACKLLDIGV